MTPPLARRDSHRCPASPLYFNLCKWTTTPNASIPRFLLILRFLYVSCYQLAFFSQRSRTSEDYLATLHHCVAESTQARTERDKRRRKVLVEQMKALYEQEVSVPVTRWCVSNTLAGCARRKGRGRRCWWSV